MRNLLILLSLPLMGILTSCGATVKENDFTETGLETAEVQLKNQLAAVPEPTEYPRTTKDGKLKTTKLNDWTEGFYPGCLWYLYEWNKKEFWKQAAIKWTEALEPMKNTRNHHDVGFLMYCSFGNAYRLTGNEKYKEVLIASANSLCTRYHDAVGCIESWNKRMAWNGKDEWLYPVIIDNMMNLELLYWASKATGDPKYATIATNHARNTAKNQFREDYSNYHVVNYDEHTGEVLHKATCQGFSDNSAWARGQAWAIYGFTMVYRETKDPFFLDMALKTAEFWLSHPNMPEDSIPYWDFNAGQPGYTPDWEYDPAQFATVPRDASAAAITASAFLELANYVEDGDRYHKAAEHILKSLSSPAYLAAPGSNCNFVLMHSVGSIPHGNEIDVPLVYADYYYLEALLRYRKSDI